MKKTAKLLEAGGFKGPVLWTADASGAVECARLGLVTVIVDVIDMSTSLEACRHMGAICLLGASPAVTACPVEVNPAKIVTYALEVASRLKTKIIIVSEPRSGSQEELRQNAGHVVDLIEQGQGQLEKIIPNLGSEIGHLADFKGKVVIGVTATGGTAFDAAFNILTDERVTTATIARIKGYRSQEVIARSLARILELAANYRTGIGFVAASKNSLEDVLAAQYLAQQVMTGLK